MRTPSETNVAAEARAVAAGHHAWVQPDGSIHVKSDTWGAEKWYAVTFLVHTDGLITFNCEPHGRNAFRDDHLYAVSERPGVTPCMHASLAARRLCREGLARYDALGRWEVTDKARALQAPPEHAPTVERDEDGFVFLVCPCGWRLNYAGTEAGAQRELDCHVAASKPMTAEDILNQIGMRS